MSADTERKQIFVKTILSEIQDQSAHGAFMLPWPGIVCSFDVDPEHITRQGDVEIADVGPMAQRLLEFLASDEPLMPFLAPYLPGTSYLTRFGASHVWSVQPGWGKVRPRTQSNSVEYRDAGTGAVIDPETGVPIVLKKPQRN